MLFVAVNNILPSYFEKKARDLRDQIAKLAKKLATQFIDPKTLESFIARRLLLLNENPGVHPGVNNWKKQLAGF